MDLSKAVGKSKCSQFFKCFVRSDDRIQKVGVIGKVMEYYRVEDLEPYQPMRIVL